MKEAEEQIAIDLGNEYEAALNDASQEEIIDLAGDRFYPLLKASYLKNLANYRSE